MKSAVFVAGAGAVSLALTGCGGETSASTDGPADDEFIVFSSHDEIVAAAEEEGGTFESQVSMNVDVNTRLAGGFMEKYPFIDATVSEQQNDENERTLLELEAGQVSFDTMHGGGESGAYERYLEFSARYDLLEMAEAGTLDIPIEMINPAEPHTMAAGSGVCAIAWSPDLVSEDEVPRTYEDFLDPKWKGKFMTNIEGTCITLLRQAWGVEKTEEYITDLLTNEPIWTDSDTAGLTAMVAGEFPLALGTNFYSAYRIQVEAPDAIGIAVLDPVPLRLLHLQLIREGTNRPAQALLFLEYLATEEAQGWIDEFEPAQASIYRDGTITEELVEGKEIARLDWDVMIDYQDWAVRTQELWGFPVAKVQR